MLTLRPARCDEQRPRVRHALLGLFVGLGAFGCSSDADLPKQYLGDSSQTSGPQALNGDDSAARADDGWSCLGQAPTPLPAPRPDTPVGFVLPVVDWLTRAPLAGRGLFGILCSNSDFRCTVPLGPPYVVLDGKLGNLTLPQGAAGIPMLEGFDGFIKLDVTPTFGDPESQLFIPANYYLGGAVSGDISQGPPVLMLTGGTRATLIQQSFPLLDPGLAAQTGMVIARVYDCFGNPVQDARVEITVAGGAAGGMTQFVLPNSRIPIEVPADRPLVTGVSGAVGFIGLPPGAVQLRAFRQADAEPFATMELGSVSGQLSVGALRPPSFHPADLASVPPTLTSPEDAERR